MSTRTTAQRHLFPHFTRGEVWNDPDLPVILLTAWTHLSSAVDLVKAGAADYLAKPWDDRKLLATVNNLLELGEARRALATAHAGAPMLSRTHGQTASPTTVGRRPRPRPPSRAPPASSGWATSTPA